MEKSRPVASLSLDLDNWWSYLKTHGDAGWESYPSFLDTVVPRALKALRDRDLNITFFLVGQDVLLEKNHEAIASIAAAGHEIGNHSFHHDPWLHLYDEKQIDDDLARSEECIGKVTGARPIGFRGPGFSLSEATLRVLIRRDYQYDATTLPTFIGPIGRAYFLRDAKLSDEERRRRKMLYGEVKDALRPNRPYRWELKSGSMIELPVTTVPFLKVPFHVSYVLYLSTFSRTLAMTYFKMALDLCRASGIQPSILLHPLDFIGGDDIRDLAFFPAMRMPGALKLELVDEMLVEMQRRFSMGPLIRQVRQITQQGAIRGLAPAFSA